MCMCVCVYTHTTYTHTYTRTYTYTFAYYIIHDIMIYTDLRHAAPHTPLSYAQTKLCTDRQHTPQHTPCPTPAKVVGCDEFARTLDVVFEL